MLLMINSHQKNFKKSSQRLMFCCNKSKKKKKEVLKKVKLKDQLLQLLKARKLLLDQNLMKMKAIVTKLISMKMISYEKETYSEKNIPMNGKKMKKK